MPTMGFSTEPTLARPASRMASMESFRVNTMRLPAVVGPGRGPGCPDHQQRLAVQHPSIDECLMGEVGQSLPPRYWSGPSSPMRGSDARSTPSTVIDSRSS